MSKDTIRNLEEALQLSPDNVPLRLHLASVMMGEKMYQEALRQYNDVLGRNYGNVTAKIGLAEAYYNLGKYSAAIIIYEELQHMLDDNSVMCYIKCLIYEGSLQHASELYQRLIAIAPASRNEELEAQLKLTGLNASVDDGSEDDDFMAQSEKYFMERPDTRFADVGGMERVKEEISMKIIQPMNNPDLYKAFGKKIGGGILLYGPPGCGKTYIARATAGEINAKFISIGLHDILDMWIGNSEKNLHEIFEIARMNTPCVLFFDEVDAMGASRSDLRQSAMRHVINQFLAEMDGVNSDNEGVLILAATNAPWSVDPAFRRPGRFDRIIFVQPPDASAREEIIRAMLAGKPVGNVDVKKVASATVEYSGADIKAIIDIAVESKLRASMTAGALQPIETSDLLSAVKVHRATTLEWFASAKNYALYSNESGIYDDILKYLKIRK